MEQNSPCRGTNWNKTPLSVLPNTVTDHAEIIFSPLQVKTSPKTSKIDRT